MTSTTINDDWKSIVGTEPPNWGELSTGSVQGIVECLYSYESQGWDVEFVNNKEFKYIHVASKCTRVDCTLYYVLTKKNYYYMLVSFNNDKKDNEYMRNIKEDLVKAFPNLKSE